MGLQSLSFITSEVFGGYCSISSPSFDRKTAVCRVAVCKADIEYERTCKPA